ncbi:MAG: hypothetical protein JNL42_11415, partial [Anaerolineae bacterium]|nr:hypothetical protein [Anaerolineae bacterium]
THNAYLWIAMKMGLVGLLAFVWLTAAFLIQAAWTWSVPGAALESSVILGAGVLYAGLLISAPFSPVFLEWFWTPMIGIAIGMSQTALHLETMREPIYLEMR